MSTHRVATVIASASVIAAGMLAPATAVAAAPASPPVVAGGAQPTTFLGDLMCQVLDDFFEKC